MKQTCFLVFLAIMAIVSPSCRKKKKDLVHPLTCVQDAEFVRYMLNADLVVMNVTGDVCQVAEDKIVVGPTVISYTVCNMPDSLRLKGKKVSMDAEVSKKGNDYYMYVLRAGERP